MLNLQQNSDHFPICLNIPPNNIVSKTHIPTPNNKPKILNPIPPEDIAKEIFIQQSIINQPFTPACHHQPTHSRECVCGVRQYPWHDLNGFVLEKRGDTHASISNTFDKITYNLCLKYLGNNKAPGPDNIPNSILKNMPNQFHDLLFLLF
jgi:hypothetical protein